MLLWQILGTALSIFGVFALYLSWQRKQRSWPLVAVGWAFILAGISSWSQTSGVDKGPALGIIVVMITAMVSVVIAALRTPVKQRREPRLRETANMPPASVWHEGLSVTFSILAIIFIGLIASLAASTALFLGNRALGMEHTANLTVAMFAFPILWGALATYMGYSNSVAARAATFTALIAVSGIIIYLTILAG